MNFDKIRDQELNRYLDEQDRDYEQEERIQDDIADAKYLEYKEKHIKQLKGKHKGICSTVDEFIEDKVEE